MTTSPTGMELGATGSMVERRLLDLPAATVEDQGRRQPTGSELFARYAFPPNHLGLCGSGDWRSLLELATDQNDDRGLRRLAEAFEGAYPYLQLIALENGIADPLDRRVVEAYWLGTSLTSGVSSAALRVSLETRFGGRMAEQELRGLREKPLHGARAVHAFHVLDVLPHLGLRGGAIGDLVGVMDACRIRWGSVIEVGGASLVVTSTHLEVRDGRLVLGAPHVEEVTRWLDGRGFVDDVVPGTAVSIHWDWACDVLSPRQMTALLATTDRHLALANETA